jgi:hypothetical protein
MRPSPDPDGRVELGRWAIFAIVVLAAVVMFFVFAGDVTPLSQTPSR